MDNARILVIEDDADINEVVCTRLAKAGCSCTPAYSGSEARLLLDRGAGSCGIRDAAGSDELCAYDCIVTDLMLPGLSGERLIAELRERGAGVPIIVISSRDTVADRVTLLKLGADDYLVKPFDLDELVVRVEAQLRGRGYGRCAETPVAPAEGGVGDSRSVPRKGQSSRQSGEAHNIAVVDGAQGHAVTAGRWTLDPFSHVFTVDAQPVALTNTEFSIIELLMTHPNAVFTKQQVYELCWNEPYMVDDNTVTAHVSKIRAKLKPSGTETYIKTVWGLGFKLDM
ncbi:response regulator transcription factor [Bifidobacterium scaligerum]|nr:response regulator transcription factor [Bifidobacterium scaligerum]